MEVYEMNPTDLLRTLDAGENGLDAATVSAHQAKYGKNIIQEGKRKPGWRIFLEQFQDFLVIILILAALVSAVTGDMESFFVIIAVITMNAILGTVQTLKAEKSLSQLKQLSAPTAKVLRDGKKQEIAAAELCPGDLVFLEAGDQIGADGRLVECASLQTNESALTGESTNVEKNSETFSGTVPLAERRNMVYSGSFVTYGRGTMVVTDIGMDTEVGKIAAMIQNAEARKTPLQVSLDNFGKWLSIGILIICVLVFGLTLFQADAINFSVVMDSLMFAIALAVAAIPEALSSIVTIVLSFGTQKMSRENAIMRKLQAVEGLGSVSVICSDKTGTLTQNRMTVRRLVIGEQMLQADEADAEEFATQELVLASVLCNDATYEKGVEMGDPTETALVHFAQDLGLSDRIYRENHPRVGEIPFDSDRKLMSTLHDCHGTQKLFTKGATDVLLDRMTITREERERIATQVELLATQGMRVLCFATKAYDGDPAGLSPADETGLRYLGLIAEMDPPREESAQAVAACRGAGIKPVMITGDHILTASAIAKEIGILERQEEAVEGAALDSYTDVELIDFVADKSVYARVTPEHKIRIVRAWQQRGNMVAMTGDGVNDAPALKQADVGVAMGITGTEVAKDAAAMVLTDDNFATIVKAIGNGRSIYENIKKSILFLLSGNLAGILVVLICALGGLPVPFSPIHLLFINLLTDSLPAIALGFEPFEPDVMHRKPRPAKESILTRPFLLQIGYSGVILTIATMAGYLLGYGSDHNASSAMTMAFATLCMGRLFHGFSCKSERPVLFTKAMWNNVTTWLAFAVGMLLLGTVLWIPGLHGLFQISDTLTAVQLGGIYVFSFGSMALVQVIKAIAVALKKK